MLCEVMALPLGLRSLVEGHLDQGFYVVRSLFDIQLHLPPVVGLDYAWGLWILLYNHQHQVVSHVLGVLESYGSRFKMGKSPAALLLRKAPRLTVVVVVFLLQEKKYCCLLK